MLRRHDPRHGHARCSRARSIAAATVPICPKPACLRGSWKKSRLSCSKSWAHRASSRGRRGTDDSSATHVRRHGSTHYAYEDEDQSAVWAERRLPTPRHKRRARNTTPSTTLPSSSPRGERSSTCPKSPVEEPTGRRGFPPGTEGSPSQIWRRARSTSAKEKAKKPRLRYNFLASA